MLFSAGSLFWSLILSAVGVHGLPNGKHELAKRCDNSASDRACWGNYDLSTDYYTEVPDTGATVEVCLL